MAKSENVVDPPSILQKYGIPFYGAGWIPYAHVRSSLESREKQQDDQSQSQSEDEKAASPRQYVVLAGGGGEGRSGIRNAVVVSFVDTASNSLSDQPVVKLETGSDLPYRMAVHPRGAGVVCAFGKSCRLFEWEEVQGIEAHKLGMKASEKTLTQLEDVGQQLALRFNSEGTILAVGGEDGNLRVFKWPSMETILNEGEAHPSVKDLDFSSDGKYLVSLGSGLCRVWDVTTSNVVTSLPKGNDEVFAFCRFSHISNEDEVLYIAAVTKRGANILTWNTTTWKRTRSKRIVRDAISAFNVSDDGKFLAVGTIQGDVLIINAASMHIHAMAPKAHLGLVTALTFSHDSRALVSASLDSSARLMLIKEQKKSGGVGIWLVIVMVLLAIAAYFMKDKLSLP